MKYFKLLLLTLILTTTACSNDDDTVDSCYVSENTTIDNLTGPETTTVNVPITLNVTLSISNSCGEFVEFVETGNVNTQIFARVDYSGCTCTDVVEVITVPYVFEASAPGEYNLFFASSDGLSITKTIIVT